jgi:hypothetical protein
VPSCGRVNSSKGSEGPSDFLRRSRDGRGLEYDIVRFCDCHCICGYTLDVDLTAWGIQ